MRWGKQKRTTSNLSIFDQRERAKQEGIESSYQAADSVWKKAASAALLEVAKNNREFTTDQIWPILARQGIHTHNNVAIGAIIQAGSRSGIMQKTGMFKESTNPNNHGRPVTIWRSNLYES